MKCVAGCISYEGGEIKHHKDCPFYPESLSKRFDDLVNDQKVKEHIDSVLPDDDLGNEVTVIALLSEFYIKKFSNEDDFLIEIEKKAKRICKVFES